MTDPSPQPSYDGTQQSWTPYTPVDGSASHPGYPPTYPQPDYQTPGYAQPSYQMPGYYPQPGHPPPFYQQVYPPVYVMPVRPAPSIALTLVITLFFGLFGLIPAAVHTSTARTLGMPTRKYWMTFWLTLAVPVALMALGLLMVVTAAPAVCSIGAC